MNGKTNTLTALYLGLIFTFMVNSIITHNYEFLFYGVVLLAFWATVLFIHARVNFPTSSLAMLVVWLTFHLFGGAVTIDGTRLYDLVLVPIIGEPYHIIRYDQAMHVLCYITMTRLIYILILRIIRDDASLFLVGLITILAGSGVGAMNEIVEFAAVVLLDAGDAVGGYTNTAIDIVCNTIGALIGWATLYGGLKKSQQ